MSVNHEGNAPHNLTFNPAGFDFGKTRGWNDGRTGGYQSHEKAHGDGGYVVSYGSGGYGGGNWRHKKLDMPIFRGTNQMDGFLGLNGISLFIGLGRRISWRRK